MDEDLKRGEGKDELNLAEFPLAVLMDRVPATLKTVTHEFVRYDHATGAERRRRLIITASDLYGMPNSTDEDVIIALIQATRDTNNFTSPTIHFKKYDLVKMLGWANAGRSFGRLEESLKRWASVTLFFEGWWERSSRKFSDVTFHLIDVVDLCPPDDRPYFTWNPVVFRSFVDGNIKRLDLDVYFSLRLPTARRLYRWLDKRFYNASSVTQDLGVVAFEHVGMSRKYDVNKIKERLKPAIEELISIGFIRGGDRYEKIGVGRWTVTFVSGRVAIAQEKVLSPSADLLKGLGVSGVVADRLAQTHPESVIRSQIERMKKVKRKTGVKDEAAYVVAALKDEYPTDTAKSPPLPPPPSSPAPIKVVDRRWDELPQSVKDDYIAKALENADDETRRMAESNEPANRLFRQAIRNQLGREHFEATG